MKVLSWKRLFRWKTVQRVFFFFFVAVAVPQPTYETYSDVGRVLLGYEVAVTYKHHGVYRMFFATSENPGPASQRAALCRAIKFYKVTRDKIRVNARETKNTK